MSEKRKMMPAEELSLFAEQIRLMLSAGMPLTEGVEALTEGNDAEAFQILKQEMQMTGELHTAMEKAGIFPNYMVKMVRIGEETGETEKVMAGLTDYYAREAKIRNAVRSAVTYPVIIICMMAVVIALLIIKVLPVFENVYRSLGIDLESQSGPVMTIGVGVGKWVLVLVGVALVAALVIGILMKTKYREKITHFAMRYLPVFRKLVKRTTAVRFATVMKMMIGSGFPIDRAVEEAGEVMDNEDARSAIEALKINMQTSSFAPSVEKSNIFLPLHARMLTVGEQTGQTESALGRIAEIYEQEVDETFARIVSAIEPVLVGVMAVVVGAILLTVMLPLASIIANIL